MLAYTVFTSREELGDGQASARFHYKVVNTGFTRIFTLKIG